MLSLLIIYFFFFLRPTWLFVSPRYLSQPVFKAVVGFTVTGSEDGGGREGCPADPAQPGSRRSGLLHPERPLSAEGSNSKCLLNHENQNKADVCRF